MEVLRAVSQTKVIGDVLLGLRSGQWKFDASDVVGSKLFASEDGSLHARLVSVVEEEDVTEAPDEHLYDGGVDLCRLAAEAAERSDAIALQHVWCDAILPPIGAFAFVEGLFLNVVRSAGRFRRCRC